MDQRLPFFKIFIFILLFARTPFVVGSEPMQEPSLQPPQIVEAPPIDVFTERADGWNYSKFSGEDLQTESTGIYQSLGQVPGVATSTESPHISIRGSSSLARVLGLYQGVPMNMADGFGFSDLLVPSENLGEVRIIKGPASIFWGKDAMSGAINFLPQWRDHAVARAEVGSFGEKGLFVGVPLMMPTSKSGLQVTAYNDGNDGSVPFQSTTSGLSGTRSPTDKHLQRFTANGHQSSGELTFSEDAVWAEDFGSSPGSLYSPQNLHENRTAGLAALTAEWMPNQEYSGGYRLYGVTNRNQSQLDPATPPNETSLNQSSRIGNSLNFKRTFDSSTDVSLFVDHMHDEFQASYVGGGHFQSDELETGVIGDFQFDDWSIKPGVRYLSLENSLIPALGLFQTSGGLSRWATYSQGIRAPDLGIKYANTADFKGNPDLKSETSEQIEVGFDQKTVLQPWSNYDYGVTVFTTNYKDLLEYQFATPQSTYTNVGHAIAQGVEGNASYKSDNWGTHGGLAYTTTQDENNHPLSLAPETQANGAIYFEWAIFKLELEDTLWGKYYENNVERTSWNDVDFHLSTVDVAGWDFKFSIYDLFDSPREIVKGFPEVQRRYWAALERTF